MSNLCDKREYRQQREFQILPEKQQKLASEAMYIPLLP